jgi:hypothetical protein
LSIREGDSDGDLLGCADGISLGLSAGCSDGVRLWASLTKRQKEVLMEFHLAAQMDDATDSDLAALTADLMGFRWEDSC